VSVLSLAAGNLPAAFRLRCIAATSQWFLNSGSYVADSPSGFPRLVRLRNSCWMLSCTPSARKRRLGDAGPVSVLVSSEDAPAASCLSHLGTSDIELYFVCQSKCAQKDAWKLPGRQVSLLAAGTRRHSVRCFFTFRRQAPFRTSLPANETTDNQQMLIIGDASSQLPIRGFALDAAEHVIWAWWIRLAS
jgi:hypothetical protein